MASLPTSWSRGSFAIVVSLVVAAGLGGCTFSGSCPSWAVYETAASMERDADLIVVTASIVRDGSTQLLGVDAARYAVTVGAVEKGEAVVGETRVVFSTPDYCASDPYAGGDPLAEVSTARLYLRFEGEVLRTLTPLAGVVPVAP